MLVASCIPVEEKRLQITRQWPAAAIRRLEVREVNGRINVEAVPGDQVSMVADVRSRGVQPNPKMDNQGFFRSEVDGDTLVIETRRTRGMHFHFFNMDTVRVDYRLRVPPAVALDLRTVNGRIATRGMAGETRATTVNGEVDLEVTGANEVAAKTVNGRVYARFLQDFHGASLGTVNGRVYATLPSSASFFGDFSQINGDVEAAFPLNIHSHPGNRRVSGEVNGGRYELKISTVNGNIKLENGQPTSAPPAPAAPAAPPAPPQ